MIFDVTLKIRVEVEDAGEAADWAINAAEHLNDTFNDDESMDPLVAWETKPAEKQS